MSTSSFNLDYPFSAGYAAPTYRGAWRNLSRVAGLCFDWLCNPWVLLLCKLTIGVVSAYDIFLTVKYFESLPNMELNPVGRWLMMLDEGPDCRLHQIAAFIAAKFAGNFIALCVIELLAAWRPRMSTAVALSVAAFQIGLLCYLQCAHALK